MFHFDATTPYFVGIDSDGCVFDTMRVKQCLHFHPAIIRHWGLEAIETSLREVAEFVNLRSQMRGSNRFLALLRTFELLAHRPEVQESRVKLPTVDSLRAYCESGLVLGNETLLAEVRRTGDAFLSSVLDWSLALNQEIATQMTPVPPFEAAVESLRFLKGKADVMVVSQTPQEALIREWNQHGIADWVCQIAGQEFGTKAEQLRMATEGRYEKNRILMVGDALGDLKAARAVGVSFYPIQPDDEVSSWICFRDEVLGLFLAGRYSGAYEQEKVARFEASLVPVVD